MVLKTKYMVELFFCFTMPPVVYMAAYQIDNYFKQLEVSFRDKSARYGKELKPGEPPSW